MTGEIFNNCTAALFVFCQHVAAVWVGWILLKINQKGQTCFVSNLFLSHFAGAYNFHWGSFFPALHVAHITIFHACMLQGRQVSKETDAMSWLIWTTYKLIMYSRLQGILCFQFQSSIPAGEHVASPLRVQCVWNDQYQERHPQTDISHSSVLFRPLVKVECSPDNFIDRSRPGNAEQGSLHN